MSPSSELAARLERLAQDTEDLATNWQSYIDHSRHSVTVAYESPYARRGARLPDVYRQHAADLRAAAQAVRAMEWRPIAGAPDDKPLLTGRWVEREWMEPVGTFSKLAAQRLGYTHYFIVPGPPEVGG